MATATLATPPASLLPDHRHPGIARMRDESPNSRLVLRMIREWGRQGLCAYSCAALNQSCSPWEIATTAMGAHFFPLVLKLYSEDKVRLEPVTQEQPFKVHHRVGA